MRRPGRVQRRRVVFIGVEGKSDRAFARFLGGVFEDAGLHLHLDVRPASGGDSVAVDEETGRRLRRHPDPRSISERLVPLDSDRIEADKAAGRDVVPGRNCPPDEAELSVVSAGFRRAAGHGLQGAAAALRDSPTPSGPRSVGERLRTRGLWSAPAGQSSDRVERRAALRTGTLRVRERAVCVAVEGTETVIHPVLDCSVPFGCEFRQ